MVRTTLAEKNIDARFDLISDSAQLHDSAETYDMAFLDIGMTPYNGLEIAARLKKRNRNIIIFLSHRMMTISTMPWICTFQIYIQTARRKAAQSGSRKALKLIDRARTSFLVKESGKPCVSSQRYCFVEIAGRSTRVVTTQGEYNSETALTSGIQSSLRRHSSACIRAI